MEYPWGDFAAHLLGGYWLRRAQELCELLPEAVRATAILLRALAALVQPERKGGEENHQAHSL